MGEESLVDIVKKVVNEAHRMKEEDTLFYAELNAESERGAAILAAEYFDERLRKAIEQRLSTLDDGLWKRINENGLRKKFVGGTPASRIVIGHVLGLYNQETRDRLKVVRYIRNLFAHPSISRPIDFNTQCVANKCNKFPLTNIPEPDNCRNRYIHYLEEVGDMVWSALKELQERTNSG